VRRLKELAGKLAEAGDKRLHESWPAIEDALSGQRDNKGDSRLRESFLEKVASAISRAGQDYITLIQAMNPEEAGQGTAWLQGIVDEAVAAALSAD
jgi:hypothetical protein